MTRLSAVLCVHNEEQRLARCLDALGFADEIVLVLDRCTDRTRAIGEAYGAVMLSGVFPLEGSRRAAGMNAATGDWILEIDADEIVSAELAQEILASLDDTRFAFRKAPIDNYVGDRLIRHGWGGAFGTSLAARFYRRGSKRWGHERVHPGVTFDGPEGPKFTSPLHHQFADSVSDVFRRLDRYTDLKAQDLREHGGKMGIADNVWRGLRRFWKCYVKRRGWKEGGWGLMIAMMAGLYPLISALRADLDRPSVEAANEPAVALARAA
ncbi:glycosyltransferase family 2 protein [Phenylobacterium sp.]|jgi:glycosyltransferase involved in cell wall biosynthesis|uniref:glycosyltransferase family 2 protein n=1 Tax=Phenylobacterium sp. TaxID=1871053 RepID=UPI002E312851|nr:glycosyltransferase family 2 protein [Phenylobacterium sp.]HEX3366625.1 glycosyltransferase family 2 protein [Phenylobacterium sp.]